MPGTRSPLAIEDANKAQRQTGLQKRRKYAENVVKEGSAWVYIGTWLAGRVMEQQGPRGAQETIWRLLSAFEVMSCRVSPGGHSIWSLPLNPRALKIATGRRLTTAPLF
jgi:hypothetical protein